MGPRFGAKIIKVERLHEHPEYAFFVTTTRDISAEEVLEEIRNTLGDQPFTGLRVTQQCPGAWFAAVEYNVPVQQQIDELRERLRKVESWIEQEDGWRT